MTLSSSRKVATRQPRSPSLSGVNFRNIVILTLGIALGIGGTLFTYSATDNTVSNIISLVNTQCNKDKTCIREVANGLERAASTLMQVVRELNGELSNMPDTPAVTPGTDPAVTPGTPATSPGGGTSTTSSPSPTNNTSPTSSATPDLGCYYRMSDVPAQNDVFSNNYQTFHIDHQSKVTGLASSHFKCTRITLSCVDTKIQVLDTTTGAPLELALTRSIEHKNDGSTQEYSVYSVAAGAYLGDNTANCEKSEEFRQMATVTLPPTLPPTQIVDQSPTPISSSPTPSTPISSSPTAGTIGGSPATTPGTASSIVSPENPAVASLPPFPTSGVNLACPGDNVKKGMYYSSYYQCKEVDVYCNRNNVLSTSVGDLKDIFLDQTAVGVYNRVKYPQYLGKSQSDCKIAIEHALALERAGVYR